MPEEWMPDEWMSDEQPIVQELTILGPLMEQQQRLDTVQPDAEFAQRLRNRLTGQPAEIPAVVSSPVPARRPRFRWAAWGGLAAVAALAAAIVLALRGGTNPQPATHPVAAIAAPTPNPTDLTRSYPLPLGLGGGGGPLLATVSRIEPPYGVSYPGHLSLTAPALPTATKSLPAYRLRNPAYVGGRVGSLARILGIGGPVQQVKGLDSSRFPPTFATFVVAEASKPSISVPQHSVAVSLLTGSLIYHDQRLDAQLPGKPTKPATPSSDERARAGSDARAWLQRIGWPGASMPVTSIKPVIGTSFWEVRLGWPGVGPAGADAAILWVGAGGRVGEALVWPPIWRSGQVTARSPSAAWRDVQTRSVPVGVERGPYPARNGSGSLGRYDVIQVLTFGREGVYLTPAYRFRGTAHLQTYPGSYRWYALAPAQGR